MEVFLIPVEADRYELYCEVPDLDDDGPDAEAPQGLLPRAVPSLPHGARRRRTRTPPAAAAADESGAPPVVVRAHPAQDDVPDRREHRRAAPALAHAPPGRRRRGPSRRTCREARALQIVRASMQSDFEKHRFWLIVDLALFVALGRARPRARPEPGRLLLRVPPGRPLPLDARRAPGARAWCVAGAAERAARPNCARPSRSTPTSARRACTRSPRGCSSSTWRGSSCASPCRARDIVPAPRPPPGPPTVKLRELAERLGCRLEGDGAIEIRASPGSTHAGPGDLTFFANPSTRAALRRRAPRPSSSATTRRPAPCAMLRVAESRISRSRGRSSCSRRSRAAAAGVHPTAIVGAGRRRSAPACRSARSSSSATARAIGDRVDRACARRDRPGARDRRRLRHPRARVDPRARACSATASSSRTAPSSAATGSASSATPTARTTRSRRSARVVIEDDVEIGANTTIDRPGRRRDADRRRHEDRQPRADRARRARRPERAARGAGRHRGQHARSRTT